jgi:translation initiation factor IF-3
VPRRPAGKQSTKEEQPIASGQKTFGRPSGPNTRINSLILAKRVRVIGADNSQLGVLDLQEAMRQAQELGLDLVEVAPGADPPVCRIMDYGQYKYQQSKRQHEAKKNQKIVLLKEIKMRPRTEEHDFQFKLKHATEFVEEGNKVKITIMFRGRELSHQELGKRLMERFVEAIQEHAQLEAFPRMEGRMLTAVLAPKKAGGAPKADAKPKAPKPPAEAKAQDAAAASPKPQEPAAVATPPASGST